MNLTCDQIGAPPRHACAGSAPTLSAGWSGRMLRAAAIAASCVALLLLTGCSALRLGYNQADWLAFRWLDSYADFDDAQAVRVREAIRVWFAWHRKTQLADYADFLMRIDAEALADTNAERVCELWGAVRLRIDRSVTQALPAMAEVALSLKPAQLAHIEQRYAKGEADFREKYMQADPAQRASEALERVVDRAESFYDDLEPAQRERLDRWVADSPFDPRLTLAERRRRQQDALQTLRQLAGKPVESEAARAMIQGWVERFNRSPRESHRLYAERVIQHNCRITAYLHNSASATQRQNLSKKLRGWATDLRVLAGESIG